MEKYTSITGHHSHRLLELEAEFRKLEPLIQDSPEKKAISILHGMLQEIKRSAGAPLAQPELSVKDIANLYRKAPKMEAPALNKPLPEGTPAPDFELPDSSGNKIRLSDYRGQNVLLVFYPLDWSPGCSQQLDLYQQELDAFKQRGIELLAISVDSMYSHGAWAAVRGLQFPLLADFNPKGEVAKRYGVYREPEGFSERALYLIDGEGVIQYSHVSPMLHHVPDIYELFAKFDKLSAAVTA